MIEYLKALADIHIEFSVSGVLNFINNLSFPVATVAIGLLVLLAVQGYKIFRSVIYVIAAVGLGFVGHIYLAPRVSGLIVSRLPEGWLIDVDVVIAFLCAMFGVLIAHLAHDFVVFCMGGAAGFIIGYFFVASKLADYFFKLEFLRSKLAYLGVACVLGMMVAIIFLLLFKHMYIIVTSVGFMALSGYLLYKEVMPDHKLSIAFGFVAVCIVIGVFMMVHQFEEDQKRTEFMF